MIEVRNEDIARNMKLEQKILSILMKNPKKRNKEFLYDVLEDLRENNYQLLNKMFRDMLNEFLQ